MFFDVGFFITKDVDDSAFPEIHTCEVENLISEMSSSFFFWEW